MPKVGSGNGVANIRVHRESLQGVNSLDQLPNVKSIYIQHANGFYKYQVNKIIVDPVDSDAFYLTIKQEHNTAPTGSASSPTVFTPYIAGKFNYSDFDVLQGNATEENLSNKFLAVDRNNSQLNPTNLDAINNRTAGFAEVQESNYEVNSYKGIRYDGSTHTADDVNIKSTRTGLVPVEHNSAYFGYFTFITKTTPELHKKTEAHLEYLFDLDGNRIPLDDTEQSIKTVQQNFRQGSFVNLTLDDSSATGINMISLNGQKKVYKPGAYVDYISGTEVTLGVFTSSIDFPAEGNVTDYGFLATSTINQAAPGGFTQLSFAQDYDAPGYYASDTYTFGEDSAAQIAFRVQGTFQNDRTQAHDFIIRIKDNSTIIATKTVEVPATSTLDFDLANDYRYFTDTHAVTVEFYSTAGVLGVVKAGAEFDLVQTPAPKLTISSTGIWTAGSPTGNSITSSAALASVYGTRIQSPNYATAFPSASLPFTVEVGDEFRFDGNEVNTYIVSNVIKSGKVYVEFDKNLNANIDVENFTHRRYIDSSKSIILNTDKPAGTTTGGIIRPKYMDSTAEEKIGKVISDLRERGII